ncbi:DNA-binding transcriptional regulator, MarR family [Enhydrobacter aerosaccus]|uniref:DNA-binding transcriptional regulator, MarR family n=1 Tax=Enhydrobacter aerosaccus TaxID=225324 RepID=A0A1T4T3A7_9HYPH|nr:MarR family transcriptional regulator [Enhydrobacter aerosaccus]SKA35004.1 DNA-binding transcriptional regulator, MarR family [Enhydrobacter aerosaccus]
MARTRKTITSSPARDIATSWTRERPDLDPLDYLLPIYLIRIGRIVDRVGDRKWQRLFGLSASEIRVLLALRRSGGDYALRPTDLFRALLVTSGAITKKVGHLTAAGLVKRRADPADKGGFLVHLTAKGKHIADQAIESLADDSILSKSQISLSRKERELMMKLCERILLDFEANPAVDGSFE